ncbi:MAG TPA: DUF4129 domain-containing protein [Micromonosporaceae bacterium]|jgi:hypothetical protein
MTRSWTSAAAVLIDRFGLGGTILLALILALVVGLAWQTFPAWLPRRSWGHALMAGLRALGRLRLPHRRPKPERPEPEVTETPEIEEVAEEVPDVPAVRLVSLADAYAAEGRFAEAVRERFRAIVRELVEAGVIVHRPSWTVLELSRAAGAARPDLVPPLDEAGRVFSGIWYGQRPAHSEHDQRMRACAHAVHEHLSPAVHR